MNSDAYNLLSPRERDCLRLLSRDREPHEIAAELQIAPGTLANHIKNARAKLGGITRYQAARELREYEAMEASADTEWVPEPVLSQDSPARHMPPRRQIEQPSSSRQAVGAMMLREERTTFVVEKPDRRQRWLRLEGLGGLETMVCVVALIAAVAICASLAFPIAEGAQRLANLIDPPHHNTR